VAEARGADRVRPFVAADERPRLEIDCVRVAFLGADDHVATVGAHGRAGDAPTD
jgi:hypothetical protein